MGAARTQKQACCGELSLRRAQNSSGAKNADEGERLERDARLVLFSSTARDRSRGRPADKIPCCAARTRRPRQCVGNPFGHDQCIHCEPEESPPRAWKGPSTRNLRFSAQSRLAEEKRTFPGISCTSALQRYEALVTFSIIARGSKVVLKLFTRRTTKILIGLFQYFQGVSLN